MTRFVRTLPLAVAAMVALSPAVLTHTATASETKISTATDTHPHQLLEDLPPEYEEMLADFQAEVPGISAEEALSRLTGQDDRIRLLESLGNNIPGSFGGGWYDPSTGIQHLVITSETAEQVARASAERYSVRSVTHRGEYSYRELLAAAKKVTVDPGTMLGEVVDVPAADVDVQSNRVRVELPEPALSRARARGLDPRLVVAPANQDSGKSLPEACTSKNACGSPLRSGITLDRSGGGDCSVGYRARASDGSFWVLGAGHCGAMNETWGHGEQYFGPVRQTNNTDFGVDVARAHLQNSYWISGGGGWQYNARDLESPTPINGAITNYLTIQDGDLVCLNSKYSTLGNSCGFIAGSSNGFRRVTFDACPGDSGGAWIYKSASGYTWAYGVHQGQYGGGERTCHVDGESSIFTTLPHMNNYFDSNSAATIRVETR